MRQIKQCPVNFWFTSLFMTRLVGVVSTFWFAIGGTIDLRRLFKALAKKEVNDLDDGSVSGNVSAVDAARMDAAEKNKQH